jgi:hypothetical protein
MRPDAPDFDSIPQARGALYGRGADFYFEAAKMTWQVVPEIAASSAVGL